MWPFDRSVRLARVRIVWIDIRARRRAIHGDPTLSNRMFVLIEQRNMISSGSNVPSSPRKEEIDRLPRNRSISRVDHRAVNRHQTSRSRLFVLLERRDRIVNGKVLISPATDKQRRSNRVTATPVLNSRSDLQTNSPGDTRDLQNSGFAKQTTKTNTIQQSTSVGAVLGL